MNFVKSNATELKLNRVWEDAGPYWDLTLLHTEALVDNVRKSCAEDPVDLHMTQHTDGQVSLLVSYRLTRRVSVDAVLRPSMRGVQIEYRTRKTLLSLKVRSLVEASKYIRWAMKFPQPLVWLWFVVFSR